MLCGFMLTWFSSEEQLAPFTWTTARLKLTVTLLSLLLAAQQTFILSHQLPLRLHRPPTPIPPSFSWAFSHLTVPKTTSLIRYPLQLRFLSQPHSHVMRPNYVMMMMMMLRCPVTNKLSSSFGLMRGYCHLLYRSM